VVNHVLIRRVLEKKVPGLFFNTHPQKKYVQAIRDRKASFLFGLEIRGQWDPLCIFSSVKKKNGPLCGENHVSHFFMLHDHFTDIEIQGA